MTKCTFIIILASMNSEKHHHGNADQISPLPASEYQGILRNKL